MNAFTGNAGVGDGFPLAPIAISLLYNQGNTTMLYISLLYSYAVRYWDIPPGEWPCTFHGVKCNPSVQNDHSQGKEIRKEITKFQLDQLLVTYCNRLYSLSNLDIIIWSISCLSTIKTLEYL